MAKKEQPTKQPLWATGELVDEPKAEKQPLWASGELIETPKAKKQPLWATGELIEEPVKPVESNLLRETADVPLKASAGVVSGVRMIADALGANNPVSSNLRSVENYIADLYSAQSKSDSKKVAEIMKDAEDKGVGDNVRAAFEAFKVAPVDLLSNALGTAAPTIIGGLAGGVLKLGTMGIRALQAGIGATMGAGVTKGAIYDSVKEELSKTKMPADQVEARAQLAQAYDGENLDQILAGTALSGLAGTVGIESKFVPGAVKKIISSAGSKSVLKEAGLSTVKESIPEVLQGGQEQLAQNLALQREGFDVPTMRGVAGQGALEGLAGAGLGATVGTVSQIRENRAARALDAAEAEIALPGTAGLTDEQMQETRDAYIKRIKEQIRGKAAALKASELPEAAEPAVAQPATNVAETATIPVTKLDRATINSLGLRTNTNAYKALDGLDITTPEGRTLFEQTIIANQDKVKEDKVNELLAALPPIEPEVQNEPIEPTPIEPAGDRASVLSPDEQRNEVPAERAVEADRGAVDTAGVDVGQPAGGTEPVGAPLESLKVGDTTVVGTQTYRKTDKGFELVAPESTEVMQAAEEAVAPETIEAPVAEEAVAPESTEVMQPVEEVPAEDPTKQARGLSSELRALDPTNPMIEDLLAYDVDEDTIAEARDTVAQLVQERQAKGQTQPSELRELSEDLAATEGEPEELPGEEVRFSKEAEGRPATAEDAHDATTLENSLKALFVTPSTYKGKVKIYNNEEEARMAGALPAGQEGVQGFVNKGVATFIAGNIAKGREIGVFLHELGAHLGFDTLLGPENREKLGDQIREWSTHNNTNETTVLAQRALARAQDHLYEDHYLDEVIAYFVEEAVNSGINPQAVDKLQNKGMRDWFRKFMSLMRTALRKIGLNKFQTLTAQNIVDLAYGAADLELSGAWHGTAADFRKFDHNYMGAGEGAQAFGWGTYLAQRRGIGKEYMEADIKRKTSVKPKRLEEILNVSVFTGGPLPVVLHSKDFVSGKFEALIDDLSLLRVKNNKILIQTFNSVSDSIGLYDDITTITKMDGSPIFTPNELSIIRNTLLPKRADSELTPQELREVTMLREAIKRSQKLIEQYASSKTAREFNEDIIARYQKSIDDILTTKVAPEGSLLRVRPLVAESELLDWDALVKDQPKAVRDIIENNIPSYIIEEASKYAPNATRATRGSPGYAQNVTGQTLYRAIQSAAREGDDRIWGNTKGEDPQKAASMYLDRIGIPGLKFLDALSRGPAEYDRVEVRDVGYVASYMNGPWEVVKQGPSGGYVFGTYATEAEAKKAAKLAEKELEDTESARTRNIVVFNDKNLSRVATQKGADINKIRYSKKQQAVAQLQKKSGIKKPSNKTGKSLFKSVMDADLNHAIDNLSSAVLSSDNGLNNQMRLALEKAGMPWSQIKEILEGLMTSQATHSQNVATMFLEMGKIGYNKVANMFEVTENPNGSWGGMMQTISDLAKKYGMSMDEMELAAHTYFVANRSRGLINSNNRLKKKALALELAGKRKEADRLLDKIVLVNMTPAEIKAGLDIRKEIPELGQVVEQWNVVRLEVINHLVNTGLYSQEQAAELADTFDYVPFYREAQLEANQGPKENTRGLLDRARQKHIKGSYNPVNNVFDNMNRWITYSIARGINNSQGQYAVKAMQQNMVGSISPKPLPPTAKVPAGNLVAVWENGVEKRYRVEDPMFVHYFTGARAAYAPLINSWAVTGVNKVFRAEIILDPIFSAGQVVMDGLTGMFTSGVKHWYMIPIRAIKEFVLTIPNWSKTHKVLRGYGTVGETDFASVSKRLAEEAKYEARDMNTAEKIANTLLKPLRWITTASDNAIRQAIYEQEMAESGDKATALRKAFEVINFRRAGYSSRVNTLRQSVNFTGAYLQYINVSSKVLTGKGITPTQKKQTYVRLVNSLAGYGLLSFIIFMSVSDDDEYKETDQTTRDLRQFLPGITEKLGVWLPVRADPFMLLAKMLPEHIYNLSRKEGGEDWTKFKKAFKAYMASAALGPTPIPQFPKVVLETMMNKSITTGRPIVGTGIEGRANEREFTSTTSEFSRMLGSTGLVSPVMADYWINNLGASVGRAFIFLTNALMKDSEAPQPSTRDKLASFAPKFIKREFGTRAKNDLYELRDIVDEAYQTYKDVEKIGSQAEYDKTYEETIDKVMAKPGIDIAINQLAQIRAEERLILESPPAGMTKQQKEDAIKKLRTEEQELLFDIQYRRDLTGLDKGNPFR
jgi:hypothetical protein